MGQQTTKIEIDSQLNWCIEEYKRFEKEMEEAAAAGKVRDWEAAAAEQNTVARVLLVDIMERLNRAPF